MNPTNNGLAGTISSDFLALPFLELLDLSMHDLQGSMLENFARMSSLASLSLRDNNLGGAIPYSLGQGSRSLKHLDLSSNAFGSTLPSHP